MNPINDIKESNNSVRVQLKQSSSSGKYGYDIDVQTDGKLTQETLEKMAEAALTVALKTEIALKDAK